MLLWTIQPKEVYEHLKKEGTFIADPLKSSLLEYISFKKAYNWMIIQMENAIGMKPEHVKTPIWAWHTYDFKHKASDLRRREFNAGEGEMVCIELDIPESELLLSDEEAWYCVLSDEYLPIALCEDEYDKELEKYEALSCEQQKTTKFDSWNRIFELEPYDSKWCSKGKWIQATFWELKIEYVKSVRYFNGRKYSGGKYNG